MVANQEVSITQFELDELKKVPGIKFDLPITHEAQVYFINAVGKPKARGFKVGVYVFTHKPTGDKYVGSSNNLSRRLDQYFTFKHLNKNSGQLVPLIKKEGFDKFSLEIFVMPTKFSSDFYFLFLEQYYLLDKKFNLNTQRVVNFRVNQGTNIYMYDLEGKILYYTSKSLNQIRGDLGIHHNTCANCIKNGNSYLNFFKLSDIPLEGVNKANLSNSELVNLISEKKSQFLKDTSKLKFSVLVTIKDIETGKTSMFPSILDVVKHFESKNVKVDKNKIAKCLKTGEVYKGYIFYIENKCN